MTGLLAYASYLPAFRLAGADIGTPKRDRVIASYDEDSTTMAVAAAAVALRGHRAPPAVYFATSSPAYADKTNATAIHAALGLPPEVFAADLGGAGRSGFAAIRAAGAGGGLAVCADVRVGRPCGSRRLGDTEHVHITPTRRQDGVDLRVPPGRASPRRSFWL